MISNNKPNTINKDQNISTVIAQEEHFIKENIDQNGIFIDYSQNALHKLLALKSNTNYDEKLQYVKHLGELIRFFDEDGIKRLGDILILIIDESQEIKKSIITQINPIVNFLIMRGERGYLEIVNFVIPALSNLINTNNLEIKEGSAHEMAKLANILNEDDRGKYLLTVVLGMAHDDQNEENRIVAVQLLSKMALAFGKDLCEQFIGLEFLSLGEDPQVRVRKEVVLNLSNVGKIVSSCFFKQRLFPFYLKSCKDPMWSIRKACVDTIVEIAKIVDSQTKECDLTEKALEFLKDQSKWVKISAYNQLGPFIAELMNLKIHDKLIDHYLKMADSSINSLAQENEISISCAYNFPAVLFTLGQIKWSALAKLHNSLLKMDPKVIQMLSWSFVKVKLPLACALHETANIIGEIRAEAELLPIFRNLLNDSNESVRHGVIKNIAFFFKVFNLKKREELIDIVIDLLKNQKKWRIKELIAKQIDKLSTIYSLETTFSIIGPISFKLCDDFVSIVRKQASKKVYSILQVVYDEEKYRKCIIDNIIGFSFSKRYTNRQSFITMCENLMEMEAIFIQYFLSAFILIAEDSVPNVRISLAKALRKKWKHKSSIMKNSQIKTLIEKLKNDKCIDVRTIINEINYDNHTDDQVENSSKNQNSPEMKHPNDSSNISTNVSEIMEKTNNNNVDGNSNGKNYPNSKAH